MVPLLEHDRVHEVDGVHCKDHSDAEIRRQNGTTWYSESGPPLCSAAVGRSSGSSDGLLGGWFGDEKVVRRRQFVETGETRVRKCFSFCMVRKGS